MRAEPHDAFDDGIRRLSLFRIENANTGGGCLVVRWQGPAIKYNDQFPSLTVMKSGEQMNQSLAAGSEAAQSRRLQLIPLMKNAVAIHKNVFG